jgi:maleylpyruvate isomerase
MGLKLYSFYRSAAAWRVRIALNLKGLAYETVPVNLRLGQGEQHAPDYATINPTKLVPTLMDGSVKVIQSMAIIEYLQERYPEISLYPEDIAMRAHARGVAQTLACDVHPLQNLRVLQHMERVLHLDEATRDDWYRHWVGTGLLAVQKLIKPHAGVFCFGDTPGVMDALLVPQMFNARRMSMDLRGLEQLVTIDAACSDHPAFVAALPQHQPDAPTS